MEKELFNVEKFNIIQDEENYYFFRALNNADNSDIEQQITVSEDGKIERIRTDRERYEGQAKYAEDSQMSLEEVYDHIKMRYRKDTNCISLTSNGNVAIDYGRAFYKDRYIMIKIPKKEIGEETVVAGQYMLQQLYSKIQQTVDDLEEERRKEILDIFEEIEEATEDTTLKSIITTRYTAKTGEVKPSKAHPRKGIVYVGAKQRISSYQALNEEQVLELNKVYAKLAILENEKILKQVIPHVSNEKLRRTIGSAFSSTEIIHYGDIKQENIVEIPKEIVDIFSLVQQVEGIDKNKLEKLKQELIKVAASGKTVSAIEEIEVQIKSDISIEEMYELTEGRVEYGKANSIVKNMFYLSKARKNAIKLSEVLTEMLGENSEFEDIIQHISENGFRVEPEITIRQSGKGVKLSESVNINIEKEEQGLIDEIKTLSSEELDIVLQNGGLYNAGDIITRTFGTVKENKPIDKARYYAEAIVAQYNWQNIGIEEIKKAERNELIKKLQERNCVEIYEKLKEYGIEESKIPTVLLNIATREGFYKQYEAGNLEELLNTRQDILQNDINIELLERLLGYYDIENIGIILKDYQLIAFENINKIYETKKFAQVILPTGAGKSFVALAQLQKYAKEHPGEKLLYLAPQEEILNQIKYYIVNVMHGKKETAGKTTDEIIAEIFPNITFETYPGLLAKRGKEVIEEQYGMIVLDELHRTGAKEWESQVDKLLENQTEDVKVLGITATPIRDADGRDMANETAKKLGYTDEEIKERKHIAANMTLKTAIRLGYVVNPKIVYCKYSLISSGKLNEMEERINELEDENRRAEELQKYNKFKEKLIREIDEEIGEEARKKLEEEEARKNLNNVIGKEEIIRQNVKKGGKYIVFIPVTDQGDEKDENGERIGTKIGEEKINAYQEYLKKVFEGTDIEPEMYSLLGSYSKNRNQEELEEFELEDSDKTKFLVVMDKANEGMHILGLDGLIWFRALDKDSRILYLQQFGRIIYAIDENNPVPDDKRPIAIDLANNSLIVNIEEYFEKIEPIDDLEALRIVVEWMNERDGTIPNRNSTNRQEKHYYAVLRAIQNEYSKYLEGFEKFEDLSEDEKQRIQEIMDMATEIDLWEMDLPPLPKTKGTEDEFNPFEVEGVLKDFVELEKELDNFESSNLLKNAQKIEAWCKSNFEEKEVWERRLPSSIATNEEEKKLANKWLNLSRRLKQYEGEELDEVEDEEDRAVLEIVRRVEENYAYGLGQKHHNLGQVKRIEAWCESNFEEKEVWERRLPSTIATNEEEKGLGIIWSNLRQSLKPYEGKELDEVEDEEDRAVLEIVRRVEENYAYGKSQKHHNLGQAKRVEAWCKSNFGEKEVWERRLPNKTATNEEEKGLGNVWQKLSLPLKQYKGKELDEVEDEEDRAVLEIVRRVEENYAYGVNQKHYKLGQAKSVEAWCESNFGEKEVWERRLPNRTATNEEEKGLGDVWRHLSPMLKKYEGEELDKVEDEEDRAVLEIVRRVEENYAYGLGQKHHNLGQVKRIEAWCESNFGEKEVWERRLPIKKAADEEEKGLGSIWINLRQSLKPYEGKELDEVEDEEDRAVLEIIRRVEENYAYGLKQKHYNLGQALKKEKLQKAKKERDEAKIKNDEARKLEEQVAEEVRKRGKNHEEQ